MESHLPSIFVGLLGLSVLIYGILDGYDLGVGILLPLGPDKRSTRDTMIASIGPFWDANETWLVLAVGLMLIAFPSAHSVVFYELYLPALVMLLGLMVRGVAFDFRAKAAKSDHDLWDACFKYGSLVTALAQGYMLGAWVVGFDNGWESRCFATLSAIGVAAAYSYIGGAWLVLKTESQLQQLALRWAQVAGRLCFLGVLLVCVVNLLINPDVYQRWFSYPMVMFVLFLPAACFTLFVVNERLLGKGRQFNDRYSGVPFLMAALIFILCFAGLAFSFYPYIVPGRITIAEAASAPESLAFILVGAIVVIPVILAYTIYAYYVFHGKATELKYS